MENFKTKIILFGLFTGLFLITACSNIDRLYQKGESTADSFYAEIPFEEKLNLMIIPVEIRGKNYNFLFDTGAPVVISTEVYDNLGGKSVGRQQTRDSQGRRRKLDFTVIDSLALGGVTFTHTAALVADLDAAIEIKCLKIDGIVGANLMHLAYWKINPRSKTISLSSDLDKLTHGMSDSISIPFTHGPAYKPLISLTVDGVTHHNILMDTGAGHYISMGKAAMRSDDALATYYGLGTTGIYGSLNDTIWYKQTTMQVGDFSQRNLTNYKGSNTKKILGMEFLRQFVIVMNWNADRIELYPEAIETQKYNRFDVVPRWKHDRLVIGSMRVGMNSPGLQLGDTIQSVNDFSFSPGTEADYCELIFNRFTYGSDSLRLTMKNGQEVFFIRNLKAFE